MASKKHQIDRYIATKISVQRLSLFVIAGVLITSLLPANFVFAQGPAADAPRGVLKENYYRENNITFFGEDPSGTCAAPGGAAGGGGGTADVSGAPVKAAYDFFIGQGFPPFMAAGIVGNLMGESGMDPGVENGIGAFGIAQWLGGRRDALEAYARDTNRPVDDLQMQLDFIIVEFNGSEKSAGDAIRATTNIGTSEYIPDEPTGTVGVVMDKYERPSPAERRQSYPIRLDYAQKTLELYGNGAPSSGDPAPTAGGGTGTGAPGGGGAAGGNCGNVGPGTGELADCGTAQQCAQAILDHEGATFDAESQAKMEETAQTGSVSGIPVNPRLLQVILAMLNEGIPVKISSFVRPGDNGHHGQGRAIDLFNIEDAAQIMTFLYSNRETFGLDELIYSDPPPGTSNLDQGQDHQFDADTLYGGSRGDGRGGHEDHVHFSVKG